MTELLFMSTLGKEKIINCDYEDILRTVCKKYAKEINKRFKQLVFFFNGFKLNKKLTVKQLQDIMKKSQKNYILVKIMDIDVEKDSDEESSNLKKNIIDEIKDITKTPTYEKMQELVLQYGYDMEKKIEEEFKKNPHNFIEVEKAIKQGNTNKDLFILGKLGESLQNMGIKVAIDKREDLNDEEFIINNQFISSGIIKKNKYEIHVEENDNKKKYQILNNQYVQKKFIEEWKEIISKYILVHKENIYIANIREGSITFDAIFKNIGSKDIKGQDLDLDERMKNFANSEPRILSIFLKNILGACKLTLNMLDNRGNQTADGWAKPGSKRGGLNIFPLIIIGLVMV